MWNRGVFPPESGGLSCPPEPMEPFWANVWCTNKTSECRKRYELFMFVYPQNTLGFKHPVELRAFPQQ